MKNTLMICLIAIVGLVGCKKENTAKNNETKLQGTWQVQKTLYLRYENDIEKDREEEVYEGDGMLFVFEGNKLSVKNDDDEGEEYTYTLNGEDFAMREGNTSEHFNLKFNNNTQMVLKTESNSVSSTGIKRKSVTEYTFNKK